MCSTSSMVPVRRDAGIEAALAMLGERMEAAAAPVESWTKRRRFGRTAMGATGLSSESCGVPISVPGLPPRKAA